MSFKEYIYTVPSPYLSALINGDYSGLNDDDEREIDSFIERVVEEHGHALFSGCTEAGLMVSNDINNLFCDCSELTLLVEA